MKDVKSYIALVVAAAVGAAPVLASARSHPHHVQRGKASYYRLTGRKTASGKTMKAHALTAASKTLPLGTKAKVTNVETGKSVKVTVTDRGPYAKGRILDVSPRAADKLGMKTDGVASVKVKPLEVPAKDERSGR